MVLNVFDSSRILDQVLFKNGWDTKTQSNMGANAVAWGVDGCGENSGTKSDAYSAPFFYVCLFLERVNAKKLPVPMMNNLNERTARR